MLFVKLSFDEIFSVFQLTFQSRRTGVFVVFAVIKFANNLIDSALPEHVDISYPDPACASVMLHKVALFNEFKILGNNL